MAREALLTLDCGSYSDSIADVIRLLNTIGWDFRNGKMEYLPVHDNGMFDWQEDVLSYEKLFDVIHTKQQQTEKIGTILYDRNTDAGILLLAETTKEVCLSLDINRKTIDGDYTDVTWYIKNIAIKMKDAGCLLTGINYSEYIG